MSLAKTIIYGTLADIENALKTVTDLDVIDEYGYTPLIQTAIINDAAKGLLVLRAGAKVDFPDITGRTALFWAADNGNETFCRYCLQYHADPNQHNNGGQSVLVMPLIKRHQNVKQLLIKHGAKLSLAQDFLNAKILGHSFELEGRVDIVNTHNQFIEVELEGFYLDFTVSYIASLLNDFRNSFAARTLRGEFKYIDQILNGLFNGARLLTKQNYLLDLQRHLREIDDLLAQEFLVLPVAFDGHAISFIKYHHFWVRIDRGAFGRINGSAIIYQMTLPGDKTFFRNLLYKRQNSQKINNELVKVLGLKEIQVINLPLQRTGNCTWANIEGLIPLGIILLKLEEQGIEHLTEITEGVLALYEQWQNWNQERALDFCLQHLPQLEIGRQMTKIALLIAIVFQSLTVEKDKKMIDKIIKQINRNLYWPILGCYVKTFARSYDHPLWQNFQKFLERAGLDENELLRM